MPSIYNTLLQSVAVYWNIIGWSGAVAGVGAGAGRRGDSRGGAGVSEWSYGGSSGDFGESIWELIISERIQALSGPEDAGRWTKGLRVRILSGFLHTNCSPEPNRAVHRYLE